HIDDIVDPAKYPVVTVDRLDRPVSAQKWPVSPVGTGLVVGVPGVIGLHEPLRLPPDRLHDPRPGVAHADVAGLAGPRFDHLAFIVEYDRVDPERGRATATGLHRLQRRQCAA